MHLFEPEQPFLMWQRIALFETIAPCPFHENVLLERNGTPRVHEDMLKTREELNRLGVLQNQQLTARTGSGSAEEYSDPIRWIEV